MDKSQIPKTVSLSPNVLIQEIDGESVLLNVESEQYFGLDEVGTRFVSYLDRSSRFDIAVLGLLGEFDIEESILRRDLVNLAEAMKDKGLVEFGA